MHNNDKRDTKADTDVSFARNSNEAQKIVGNLINVRSQINTYAEGADYKNGQTLKEALEEKKKENKITPAKLLSFLFVIPLLLYAKNKGEQDDIQNKIDEEKKRVKAAINQSIKNGGEDSMMEEMKKMSKQQKYDIMKAAMKEYSSKMSDSFKNMSDDELKRIVNNLDSNIQTCQSLDQLKIDGGAAFVPNAQVAPAQNVQAAVQATPNSYLVLQNQQQNAQYTVDLGKDETLIKAVKAAREGDKTIDLSKNENKQIAMKVASVQDGQQVIFTSGFSSATIKAVKKDNKLQIC